MSMTGQAVQYGQRRIARKMLRSVPWLGGIVAIATLGLAIRRKGFFGGAVDTALDFIPFVGGMKNAAEIVRGRDLIRDKQPSVKAASVAPREGAGRRTHSVRPVVSAIN